MLSLACCSLFTCTREDAGIGYSPGLNQSFSVPNPWQTLQDHATAVVFWTAVLLSLSSSALTLIRPELFFLVLLGISFLFNLWCLYENEHGGFVRRKEMRRAHEPPRYFSGLQVIVLLVLVLLQVGIGIFGLYRCVTQGSCGLG